MDWTRALDILLASLTTGGGLGTVFYFLLRRRELKSAAKLKEARLEAEQGEAEFGHRRQERLDEIAVLHGVIDGKNADIDGVRRDLRKLTADWNRKDAEREKDRRRLVDEYTGSRLELERLQVELEACKAHAAEKISWLELRVKELLGRENVPSA